MTLTAFKIFYKDLSVRGLLIPYLWWETNTKVPKIHLKIASPRRASLSKNKVFLGEAEAWKSLWNKMEMKIIWEVFKYMVLAIMEIVSVDRNPLGIQRLKSQWEKDWGLNIQINTVFTERETGKKMNTVLVQTIFYSSTVIISSTIN